jgi:hypothetical protein
MTRARPLFFAATANPTQQKDASTESRESKSMQQH